MTSFEVRNADVNIAWGTRQGQHLHSGQVDSLRSGGFARFLTKQSGKQFDLLAPCEFLRPKDPRSEEIARRHIKRHGFFSAASSK